SATNRFRSLRAWRAYCAGFCPMMPAWLDTHPTSAALMAASVVSLAIFAVARSSCTVRPPTRDSTDWGWGLLVFLLLFAGRWPGFFRTREYNLDESHLLAGAMTLRHDFLFWRSVDGGTGGPLDFYALMPAGWLLGSDNYVSARLTALLLLAGALLL